MPYDAEAIVRQLRKKLDLKIIDFADSVRELPEGEDKEVLKNLRFCDVFNTASITNEDECLKELVRYVDKINKLKIGEINKLIPQCERQILTKTLNLLDIEKGGGFDGFAVKCEGVRRGKNYTLIRTKKEEK